MMIYVSLLLLAAGNVFLALAIRYFLKGMRMQLQLIQIIHDQLTELEKRVAELEKVKEKYGVVPKPIDLPKIK